jgi:DNA-directed RNA polymerase subunit E'/Rpb7
MADTANSKDEKLRWETERVLERTKEVRLRIEWTLRENRQRMKRIRADLRRAGLLRD